MIPATGLYDFNFKLFDADTGGGQISPAAGVSVNAVGVTNGVFSVTLDFGAAFNGEKRWLDMAVNTNAARPLGALAPRQPVQAAPYALYALKAAQADTAAVASSVANAAVSSASLANSAVTGQKIANGTVVRSVNGLTDGLTIAAGTNITLGTAGNTLTISAVSGSCPCPPAWLLNGNSGTDPNNNFLGTIDNQALTVRVNNLPALRLIPDASIRVNDLDPNLNIVEPQVSANLVGGYTNNFVSPDNKGATIAGGGSHYDHVFHGAIDRVIADESVELSQLLVGEAEIRLAHRHELVTTFRSIPPDPETIVRIERRLLARRVGSADPKRRRSSASPAALA